MKENALTQFVVQLVDWLVSLLIITLYSLHYTLDCALGWICDGRLSTAGSTQLIITVSVSSRGLSNVMFAIRQRLVVLIKVTTV